MKLDARDPSQVVSAQLLRADLGVEDRQLLVVSGIAVPTWDADTADVDHDDIQVNTGVFAANLEQWTAQVGLASIANTDSKFLFALDNESVSLDANGELLLTVSAALQGKTSALDRFAYQIVATVVTVRAHISGTIRWNTSLWKPIRPDPALVAQEMTVVLNKYEEIFPPNGFKYDRLTPLFTGTIDSVQVGADECRAKYRIDNPPLVEDLEVTLSVAPIFTNQGALAGQEAGPTHFMLTGPSATLDGADFDISVSIVR